MTQRNVAICCHLESLQLLAGVVLEAWQQILALVVHLDGQRIVTLLEIVGTFLLVHLCLGDTLQIA